MGIKSYKPTSPGRRFMTTETFDDVTRSEPERSLVEPVTRKGGRNNNGRITTRHQGGGHKRRYRVIDFKRDKDGVPAKVAHIEYDPNRSARIALLHYADGEKRYIVAPQGLKVGDTVESGPKRRHQGRQRPAAREHPDRHDHPQHRALPRPRRPVRAQRRHERPAPGQRKAATASCACRRANCAASAWPAGRRSARSATPTTRTSTAARPGAPAGAACVRPCAARP